MAVCTYRRNFTLHKKHKIQKHKYEIQNTKAQNTKCKKLEYKLYINDNNVHDTFMAKEGKCKTSM